MQVFSYFDIELRHVNQISGMENVADYTGLKVKRLTKKTRGIFGNLTVTGVLDDSYLIGVNAARKQGGEYRLLPYRIPPKPICTFINEDTYIYPELSASSDFPLPMPCPLPLVQF